MVLSVLLHGAAESWALSRNQLSRLETLHNSWLRCIRRDTVGRPDSISTKDLMEKTHQLPISVMIKERRLRWLGPAARRSNNNMVKQLLFATRIPIVGFILLITKILVCCTCATCWMALWQLDALCYEGCEGYGNGSKWVTATYNGIGRQQKPCTYLLGRNC